MVNKNRLTAEQLTICINKAANIGKQARRLPYIKIITIPIGCLLFIVVGVEISFFYKMGAFLNDGETEGVFSNLDFSLIGSIFLVCFHISTIKYKNNSAVRFIRLIVLFSLPSFVLGGGSAYIAGVFDSLMGIFDSDNPESEIPPILAYMEQEILPNSMIFLCIGLLGLTSVCIFCADFLFEQLAANIEKIAHLSSEKNAAKAFMKEIKYGNKEQVLLDYTDNKIQNKIDRMPETDALNFASIISHPISILDSLIMQREVFPENSEDNPNINDFAAFFNSESLENQAIKECRCQCSNIVVMN